MKLTDLHACLCTLDRRKRPRVLMGLQVWSRILGTQDVRYAQPSASERGKQRPADERILTRFKSCIKHKVCLGVGWQSIINRRRKRTGNIDVYPMHQACQSSARSVSSSAGGRRLGRLTLAGMIAESACGNAHDFSYEVEERSASLTYESRQLNQRPRILNAFI